MNKEREKKWFEGEVEGWGEEKKSEEWEARECKGRKEIIESSKGE